MWKTIFCIPQKPFKGVLKNDRALRNISKTLKVALNFGVQMELCLFGSLKTVINLPFLLTVSSEI